MNYHVLARKWRPQSFADLVGQTHVVKALTYALSHQQIHHAYLFTGTRGVGKTSIARIFAKSLNCETNGISANPCGQCKTCQEITAGKFVDLIEVDAASRTGVDETRELIDSVAYLPSKGRYKVYLIDEVHMFSKSSFNALLKTLEEPPEHVKFILATTDPEKLPITILSRCLQFNLKSLTPAQICQHLANICEAESIPYDKTALELLASAGDGSMRDTLSMTDQAIAYGHGELRLSTVAEILGTIQPNDIEAILFAIATNNPNQLSQALHRLDDYEIDARAFLIEIMRQLQRMAWAKEGIAETLSPALQSTINDIPKPLLHLWYDIAEKALPNLAIAGEPRQAVEMALLRMLAFIPEDWVVRHRTLLDTETSIETNTPAVEQVSAPTQKPQQAPSQPATQQQASPAATTTEADTSPSTLSFAQTVTAAPVTAHESLDEAEAEFSGHIAPQPTETAPAKQSPPKPDTLQTTATAQEQSDQHWQLSTENSNEPPPNMDDLRAMMQSGRDITVPKTPLNTAPETVPMSCPATVDEPAHHTEDNAATDPPPWEETAAIETPTTSPSRLPSTPARATDATADSQAAAPQTTAAHAITDFDWHDTLPKLALTDYTQHLAALGILRVEPHDDYLQATLDLPPKHELLITTESLEELSQALQNHFAQPVRLTSQLTELTTQTPQARSKAIQDQKQQDLFTAFEQEPITQRLLDEFDGKILENKLKYRNENN